MKTTAELITAARGCLDYLDDAYLALAGGSILKPERHEAVCKRLQELGDILEELDKHPASREQLDLMTAIGSNESLTELPYLLRVSAQRCADKMLRDVRGMTRQ